MFYIINVNITHQICAFMVLQLLLLCKEVTDLQLSCSEEFQGISFFFYNYEIQKLTKVFM